MAAASAQTAAIVTWLGYMVCLPQAGKVWEEDFRAWRSALSKLRNIKIEGNGRGMLEERLLAILEDHYAKEYKRLFFIKQ